MFRNWMAENKPVAEAEAMYLDKEDDLLSLNRQRSDSTVKSATPTQITSLMMVITSATALPILLFRIIPGLTSRITIVLFLVPSIAFMSKPEATGSLINGRESRHFLFVYVGVLTLAALTI